MPYSERPGGTEKQAENSSGAKKAFKKTTFSGAICQKSPLSGLDEHVLEGDLN